MKAPQILNANDLHLESVAVKCQRQRKIMSIPITRGAKVIYGVREPKPVACDIQGRQRLRMRNTQNAKLFIKTDSGIRRFILEDAGDTWVVNPALEQGRNERGLW